MHELSPSTHSSSFSWVAASWQFEQSIDRALERACWSTPSSGQSGVLVFDVASLHMHVVAASTWLDTRERMRAARYRHGRDRATYVLAHAVWRLVLGRCLGIDPEHVSLVATALGQPTLPGTDLATSLSHSGRWVAIAVGTVRCLGVDIERCPSEVSLHDLIADACTGHEAATLAALPEEQRQTALLRLWTRKEALLKAFGVGLTESPSSLCGDPGMAQPPPASSRDLPPCVAIELALPSGLVGAVAVPASTDVVKVHVLERA